MPDQKNGDESGTRLARFCSAANGRTLAPGLVSADDDLTVVSPDGGCDSDSAEDLIARMIS